VLSLTVLDGPDHSGDGAAGDQHSDGSYVFTRSGPTTAGAAAYTISDSLGDSADLAHQSGHTVTCAFTDANENVNEPNAHALVGLMVGGTNRRGWIQS
jgi:hypothetical protein